MGKSLADIDSMADEEFTFDFLLDNYSQEDMIKFRDIAALSSKDRLKRFENYPEDESNFARYSSIQDKIDSNTGLPLAYRMSIWHEIPNRQKDNVMEREQINEQIQKMYDAGISIEDAPLLYNAYDVKNEEDQDFGMNLVRIHRMNSND